MSGHAAMKTLMIRWGRKIMMHRGGGGGGRGGEYSLFVRL